MKNVKDEAAIWVIIILVVGLWLLVLRIHDTELGLSMKAFQVLPEVVTLFALCYVIFTKWGWRLPVFQGWLVPYPDLQGTWKGEIKSTWINPETQKPLDPIPMLLVIRQTFDSINCIMLTAEMNSKSVSAIVKDDDGLKKLSYTYVSEPHLDVRHRSPIHNGAIALKVVGNPQRLLEGDYWTDRKTTGAVEAQFVSRKLAERFDPDWQG